MTITPAERDAMFAPRALHAEGADARRVLAASAAADVDRLHWDEPGDGRMWALGASFKASFGPDGFTYVPWFGSNAPQHYPVRFVLRSTRVGGRELPLASDVRAERRGERVTILRGPVLEHYDLTPRAIEQTIVIAGDEPGDVDVELEVLTELVEDAARSGIQFTNELGDVVYGAAHLLRGTERIAIDTQWVDGRIRLHVPSGLRGVGPVVIDPVISTHAIGELRARNQRRPDIAFDATTNSYLVVWQHDFSATDVDILGELRRANGVLVSRVTIDISLFWHAEPRVANLAVADRFLVVTERYDSARAPGLQWAVWGRTVDATFPNPLGSPFEVTSPTPFGDKLQPDVGGDPGTGPGPHNWLVVWTRFLSSDDSDIHARLVNELGAPSSLHILIENSSATVYRDPQVSLSNGNGIASRARWVVVYTYRWSPNDWDIYGSVLDTNGNLTRINARLEGSTADHRAPVVSSPATDFSSGVPLFLLCYRDFNSGDIFAQVLSDTLASVVGLTPTNLTQSFGFSGNAVRVDSDGCRFAVAYRQGSNTWVGTLAYANNSLIMHDAPRLVASGATTDVAVASARSGGGRHTEYGVVCTDLGVSPSEIRLSIYEGRTPQAGFARRATGCEGLGLNEGGRPYLGETVHFQVTNQQSDLVGIVLGRPGALSICGSCTFGIDPAGVMASFARTSTLDLTIPCDSSIVGLSLAVQGVATGSGTCLGFLRLSDTIEMTVR